MEIFIINLLKMLLEEPTLILKNTFNMLRTLFLIIISSYIYKWYYGDFHFVDNVEDAANFILKGQFIKPVIVFSITVILFDLLLSGLIQYATWTLLIKKKEKKLNSILEELSQYPEPRKTAINRMVKIMMLRFNKKVLHYTRKINLTNIEDLYEVIKSSKKEKFDRITIIIIQSFICFCMINGFSVSGLIVVLVIVIILEDIKSQLYLTNTFLTIFNINEPNPTT